MTWFKVDDAFATHPKVMAIPRAKRTRALGVWLLCGTWSAHHCTDGHIPAAVLADYGTTADAQTLVACGLWEHCDDPGGWRFTANCDPWDTVCAVELDPRHRPRIPAQVRQAVYARDGYACRTCDASDDLTLDHVHPWSLGGSNHHSNLQTLCRSCNARKGARI